MIISKKLLSHIDVNNFNPSWIIDQLQFIPEIFPFLKSKQNQMGNIRPILIYTLGVAIWAFRQNRELKRQLPEGFLHAIWGRLTSDKKFAKALGDLIENMEPNLWEFFLTILKTETIRNQDITEHEVGIGSVIFSTIVFALIFAFGEEKELCLLNKFISSYGGQL